MPGAQPKRDWWTRIESALSRQTGGKAPGSVRVT
jgi:hypothetical protein